ncbi:rhodanese-related sulfurtransferase [Komagataeibacter sp. FNDCF1]|uniref:oxygen-dependent tRNA uridine(34) hydroxylase TrhO n=1 Tax=Komagataeibacter sp. FNDCF1 TaxID=2878681 RepID=UPI001E56C346|nr:rhodanese-related sulfurtransferase [Komagataeibacter sp. FNDCF1]MCE2563231.1 rhodanese-related sulfurtransferase [Komagataeibacter sp. FNDCF1]
MVAIVTDHPSPTAVSPPAGALPVCVAALYHFTPFEDCAAVRERLLEACHELGIRGILLVAREGINGTIAGSDDAIGQILAVIRALPGCAGLDVKYSRAPALPFHRMKVRIKREIVTMGVTGLDPRRDVGHYVPPEDWNALISDPDTIVIDTRNDYEVAIGTFRGAIDPGTSSFREFPQWFRDRREALVQEGRKPKIAMFCTGGIRCEKATAFVRAEGVEDVFHLQGGILKYLETVPEPQSLWDGECFVFDQRVSVGHGLKPGTFAICHACRTPLSAAERAGPDYEEGVSCPHCRGERTETQRQRYAERERQIQLAERRGTHHLGLPLPASPKGDTKP